MVISGDPSCKRYSADQIIIDNAEFTEAGFWFGSKFAYTGMEKCLFVNLDSHNDQLKT
jgi:hypothetical protein